MRRSILKSISLLLVITFISTQVQPAYALSAWLANDSTPMRDTKNDIAKKLEPGAIGNGQALVDLIEGKLPDQVKIDDMRINTVVTFTLREAITVAKTLHLLNQHDIHEKYKSVADETLANLIDLENTLEDKLHLFRGVVRSEEDYLLGFNCLDTLEKIGLDPELVIRLYSFSPERLAQYVYHECVPEHLKADENAEEVDRTDHRDIYTDIQTVIFGEDEVLALKKNLRDYITERSKSKYVLYEGDEGFQEEIESFEKRIDEDVKPGGYVRMPFSTIVSRYAKKLPTNVIKRSLAKLGFVEGPGRKWRRLKDASRVADYEAYPSSPYIKIGQATTSDIFDKVYKSVKGKSFSAEDAERAASQAQEVAFKDSIKRKFRKADSLSRTDKEELIEVSSKIDEKMDEKVDKESIHSTVKKAIDGVRMDAAFAKIGLDSEELTPPTGGDMAPEGLDVAAKTETAEQLVNYIINTGYISQVNIIIEALQDDPSQMDKLYKFLRLLKDADLSYASLEELEDLYKTTYAYLKPAILAPFTDGPWRTLPALNNAMFVNRLDGEISFFDNVDNLMDVDLDLWMARHGKTEGNALKVLQGASDLPGLNQLSDLGKEQAIASAEALFENLEDKIRAGEEIIVVTSTLERSKETAQAFVDLVKERTGIDLEVVSDKDADEISFGVAGNKPYEKPSEETKKTLEKYGIDATPMSDDELGTQKAYLDGDATAAFEKGENFLEVIVRSKRLLQKLNWKYKGKTVVMVGHGTQLNAVRVILGNDLKLEKDSYGRDVIKWREIELENGGCKQVATNREMDNNITIEQFNAEKIKTGQVRDFHVHSNCSDGLFTPAELVEHAAKEGVAQFVLSDHDTIEGLAEARKATQNAGIDFMPGVECSTKFKGKNVHILGYGFDPEAARQDAGFMAPLNKIKNADHSWAGEMCDLSQTDPLIVRTPGGKIHKVSIDKKELEEFSGTMPSTFHVAFLLARKLAAISDELDIPARNVHYIFFRRLEADRATESYAPEIVDKYADLLEKYGINVPQKGFWRVERTSEELQPTEDAVKSILRIGGIPVLAHPGEQKLTEKDIAEIVKMGIKGLEVHSYKHKPELIQEYTQIAKKYNLFVTSGTDFHDPYHRAKLKPGTDREGRVMSQGVSISDFADMGAIVHYGDGWTSLPEFSGKILVNPETGQIKFAEGAESVLTPEFELWSLRHGASNGNMQHILQGARNEKPVNYLSEEGLQQAKMGAEDIFAQIGAERIKEGNIVYIVSGLVRSRQTGEAFAELVKEKLGIHITLKEEELASEMSFGEWGNNDRKTFMEGHDKDKIEWHRKWKDEFSAMAKPPVEIGGENFIDVIMRNKALLEKFNAEHKGKTVVVFDHGTCITAKRVLLRDSTLVNKDGVINWQKANFANAELRNLTDPAGMEVSFEKAGLILYDLFKDTSSWTGKDWTPTMMFERTMKMAGTREVDRIAVRTIFEQMEAAGAQAEDFGALADFYTNKYVTSFIKTPEEAYKWVTDAVRSYSEGRMKHDTLAAFFHYSITTISNGARYDIGELQDEDFDEKGVRITKDTEEELRETYKNTRATMTAGPMAKWSTLQADEYVLHDMYSSALINENADRGSISMRTSETLVRGALKAAYLLQDFIRDKKDLFIEEKADKSLVTDGDSLLNDFLKKTFEPLGIPFVGEESEHLTDVISKGTYIAVDPIDGTSNFVKMFNGELDKPALDNVTLISLVKDGTPVVGICLNHYTGELDVAINDGAIKFESHINLKMLAGLDFEGTPGSLRVGQLDSPEALIMGSKASDLVNSRYSEEVPTAQIGGLGFRIISLCNKALKNGLVFHKKQKAGLWDLAAPYVFASLNDVTILDGDGRQLDFTAEAYFPGNGAIAIKGRGLPEPIESFELKTATEKHSQIRTAANAPTLNVGSLKANMALSNMSDEAREQVVEITKLGFEIPKEAIARINRADRDEVDSLLSSLALEMVDILPKVVEVSGRVEDAKEGDLGPRALHYYGTVFAELDLDQTREFMKYFAEQAGRNTTALSAMTRIMFARGFVATEGEINIENQEEKDRFMEEIEIMEKFHQYAAAETTITDNKSLSKKDAETLLKAASLAVKRDIHNFGPLLLHMEAKNFSKTLAGILRENPDKMYVIAIDSDLGKDQQSQLMETFKAFDEIQKMFPNLKLIRRSGSDTENGLSSKIETLVDSEGIDPQNVFMVVKQENLVGKKFTDLQGKAWISAIDDSASKYSAEGVYLPIFEAATISILASINADAEAIKKVYDSISLDPRTNQEIALEAIEEMISNRTVLILPRIEKIPLDELKLLYERVRNVYIAA